MNDWLPSYAVLMPLLYIVSAGLYYGSLYLKDSDLVDYFYRKTVWRGLMIFTCAQLAILIGMMWPLSAVYFQRFPISGSFANFLAIPLIGFIVQYGLVAASLVTTSQMFLSENSGNFVLSLLGMSYAGGICRAHCAFVFDVHRYFLLPVCKI